MRGCASLRKDITLENIKITTKSAGGTYYGTPLDLGLSSNNILLSASIYDWGGMPYTVVPYLNGSSSNYINFLSSNSQTVLYISLRVVYI